MKKFLEWIGLKKKLHNLNDVFVDFREGEIWWAAIGENVGIEVDGKSRAFSRPVLVYRKLGKAGFLAIPLSTEEKRGTWFVDFTFRDEKITANLAQIRVISSKRLYDKMGELSDSDRQRIKDGFLRLYS